MAGTITHKWNGTILTITSDSGSSSCDLKGDKGDMGVRGVQGAPGLLTDTTGVVLAPADRYYLKQETDDAIAAAKQETEKTIDNLRSETLMDFVTVDSTLSAHNKRITNLENWMLPRYFETDDATAFIKDVPEGALPFAEVSKIGGMTRKCTNLIPFPYASNSTTSNGVTFTAQEDGGVRIKGTCTANALMHIWRCNLFTKFWYAQLNTTGTAAEGYCASLIGSCADGTSNRVFLQYENYSDSGLIYLYAREGETYDCIVYPMLNVGSTALPYEPYFKGLRSAPVTEVKSVGTNQAAFINGNHNLEDRINLTINNGHWEISTAVYEDYFYDKWKPYTTFFLKAGTYNFSLQNRATSVDYENIAFQFMIKDLATDDNVASVSLNLSRTDNNDFVIDKDKEVYVAGYVFNSTGQTVACSFDLMISKGSGRKDFIAPTVHTLPIPAEVQALDGYGEGLNDTYYNYISWNDDGSITFNKVTKRVELTGAEDWALGVTSDSVTEYNRYICYDFSSPFATTKHCSHFEYLGDTVSAYNPTGEGLGNGASGSYNYSVDFAFLKNGSFPTLSSWKTYLAQQYAAGTPVVIEFLDRDTKTIVTDISNTTLQDNFIEVGNGGTITFSNEHKYAVPSEVTFQFKEGSV